MMDKKFVRLCSSRSIYLKSIDFERKKLGPFKAHVVLEVHQIGMIARKVCKMDDLDFVAQFKDCGDVRR